MSKSTRPAFEHEHATVVRGEDTKAVLLYSSGATGNPPFLVATGLLHQSWKLTVHGTSTKICRSGTLLPLHIRMLP